MSVYIKGMEMPDRCFACPMCDTDCCGVSKGSYIEYRDVDVDVAMDGRPDWCPLVPVPEHGDLIDRGYAIATACSGRIRVLPTTEDGEDWIRVEEVRESIKAAPTIIPASEEEHP